MATYRLYTFAIDEEFGAPSLEEARRIASLMVRRHHLPDRRSTRWVEVDLEDEEGVLVDDWLETIHPEPPDCAAPTEELEDADRWALELLWRARAWEEDGHLWARPPDLVGPPESDPSEDVCLRCGTVRWIDTDATDPVTGIGGLQAVEYSVGWYADEVAERWAAQDEE